MPKQFSVTPVPPQLSINSVENSVIGSPQVEMELVPEKITEEDDIDFKQRQRRRSSATLPLLLPNATRRRGSNVSSASGFCK